MQLNLISTTQVEPLDVQELKQYLKLETAEDDAELPQCIAGARAWAETFMNRSIIAKQYRMTLADFPYRNSIALPMGKTLSVDGVAYVDANGVTQQMRGPDMSPSGTDYQQNLDSMHGGLIAPPYGESWPTTRDVLGAVVITFTAGFGDDQGDVPQDIRSALKYAASALFESRAPADLPAGDWVKTTPSGPLKPFEQLLRPWVVPGVF